MLFSHCQNLALKWRSNNWAGSQTRLDHCTQNINAISRVIAASHRLNLWTHVQISLNAMNGEHLTFSGKWNKQFLFHLFFFPNLKTMFCEITYILPNMYIIVCILIKLVKVVSILSQSTLQFDRNVQICNDYLHTTVIAREPKGTPVLIF